MARRWTLEEENRYRLELTELYVVQNKSIGEIGVILKIQESGVFKRMERLGIKSTPHTKAGYLNTLKEVSLPTAYSEKLAEFFGAMLGDGHVSRFQTLVTLGTKELEYVTYVAQLMTELFNTPTTISERADGYRDVYIGSVRLTAWLKANGLVSNKVASQVDAPPWIFESTEFMRSFLRGFFDTDGSIYKLRFGRQISLTNKSLPLLRSLQCMLVKLGYRPSAISSWKIYLTRRNDIDRFFSEIRPANTKHLRRYYNTKSVGTQAVNGGRL